MSALITAWIFDGQGGGTEVSLQNLPSDYTGKLIWLHLDRTHGDARDILHQVATINEEAENRLFAETTRPRCEPFDKGYLINLRGVNINPGTDPVDMISARIWIDDNVIVSLRRQPMKVFQNIREKLQAGTGPENQGDFIADISNMITDQMGPIIEAIDTDVTRFEDMEKLPDDTEQAITGQRQMVVKLSRYVKPQKEVLANLSLLSAPWIDEQQKIRIRQALNSVTFYVEELIEINERMEILKDSLRQQSSERISHTMYVLSVVAGIFLPLGFLTGLLGINVGGMPGVEDKNAFWIVLLLVAVIGIAEYAYFKWKKWI